MKDLLSDVENGNYPLGRTSTPNEEGTGSVADGEQTETPAEGAAAAPQGAPAADAETPTPEEIEDEIL